MTRKVIFASLILTRTHTGLKVERKCKYDSFTTIIVAKEANFRNFPDTMRRTTGLLGRNKYTIFGLLGLARAKRPS